MRTKRPSEKRSKEFISWTDPNTGCTQFFTLHNRKEIELIDRNDPKFAGRGQKMLLQLTSKFPNPPPAPRIESRSSETDVLPSVEAGPPLLTLDELLETDFLPSVEAGPSLLTFNELSETDVRPPVETGPPSLKIKLSERNVLPPVEAGSPWPEFEPLDSDELVYPGESFDLG
jgi:hypothetical protein